MTWRSASQGEKKKLHEKEGGCTGLENAELSEIIVIKRLIISLAHRKRRINVSSYQQHSATTVVVVIIIIITIIPQLYSNKKLLFSQPTFRTLKQLEMKVSFKNC